MPENVALLPDISGLLVLYLWGPSSVEHVQIRLCKWEHVSWLTWRFEKVLTPRSRVDPGVLNIPLDQSPSRFENRLRRVLLKLPRLLIARLDRVIMPQGSSGSCTITTADRSLGSSFGRTRLSFNRAITTRRRSLEFSLKIEWQKRI